MKSTAKNHKLRHPYVEIMNRNPHIRDWVCNVKLLLVRNPRSVLD